MWEEAERGGGGGDGEPSEIWIKDGVPGHLGAASLRRRRGGGGLVGLAVTPLGQWWWPGGVNEGRKKNENARYRALGRAQQKLAAALTRVRTPLGAHHVFPATLPRVPTTHDVATNHPHILETLY